MPHFFVDDEFSDSKEVMAIPARHRLAAVGLWTLCGAWSANKLTDGFVSNEVVKTLGGRAALVDALCKITGPDGEDWSLWERVAGGIRFTNWAKWQRTRDQVKAYRDRQAEKKRNQRTRTKNADTSGYSELSPGDTNGDNESCPPGTPQTPIPIPEPNYVTTHQSGNGTSVAREPDDAPEAESATPGADLVRRIIPSEHPAAVKTALRIRASELIRSGTPKPIVEAALELWLTKPNLGPNTLAALVSEVIKSRSPQARAGPNGQPHKLRTVVELTREVRALEQAELATHPKELT